MTPVDVGGAKTCQTNSSGGEQTGENGFREGIFTDIFQFLNTVLTNMTKSKYIWQNRNARLFTQPVGRPCAARLG